MGGVSCPTHTHTLGFPLFFFRETRRQAYGDEKEREEEVLCLAPLILVCRQERSLDNVSKVGNVKKFLFFREMKKFHYSPPTHPIPYEEVQGF